jgi:hypothetical protein
MLVAIVERILPENFFSPSLLPSRACPLVLLDYVQEYTPKLHAHLTELGVDLAAICFSWFLSLFTDCLPAATLNAVPVYASTRVRPLFHHTAMTRQQTQHASTTVSTRPTAFRTTTTTFNSSKSKNSRAMTHSTYTSESRVSLSQLHRSLQMKKWKHNDTTGV